MTVQLDAIRATAERVAASHNLELVEIEFSGGAKFRTLRIFIEKNATERAKLIALAAKGEAAALAAKGEAAALAADATDGEPSAEEAVVLELPKGVPVELLSGVTHEDCAAFATDFGTVLDVEDLIPGAEYTLEVSSPGLERKLNRAEDYVRFQGSLVKLQTFTPVNANRQWRGRLIGFADGVMTLELAGVKQKSKGKAKKVVVEGTVEIALANVEKAHLVAEI